MPLKDKALNTISEADLLALIENKVPEGKDIEYKQCLPGNSDQDKHEFLADVSSFANCQGGDLVYGMKDKRDEGGHPTGVPEALVGMEGVNVDQAKVRLEDVIRHGIKPRIVGHHIQDIVLRNGRSALIVRIPKSWASPHMVQGGSRFYARHSAGKYQLDVGEIRDAFLRTHALGEKLRAFCAERLNLILLDDGPMKLTGGTLAAKVVVHMVPFQAFDPGVQFDLAVVERRPSGFRPLGGSLNNSRYNFDGFVGWMGDATPCLSYVQVFRNGTIEAGDARYLMPRNNKKLIPAVNFEGSTIEAVRGYLQLQQTLGASPPVFLKITFLNVRGYRMWMDPERFLFLDDFSSVVDRDMLDLPEVLIEDFSVDVPRALRHSFDAVWNASGLPRSLNYDSADNWFGDRG